jgi:hypothetical protein
MAKGRLSFSKKNIQEFKVHSLKRYMTGIFSLRFFCGKKNSKKSIFLQNNGLLEPKNELRTNKNGPLTRNLATIRFFAYC